MKKNLSLLLWSLFICTTVFSATIADSLQILAPRAHNPVFVQPGKTFTVEVRDLSGLLASNWKATLKNDLRSWPATVKIASRQRIHHDTEDGWKLTVSVASKTPPELMELVISNQSGNVGTSIRSVSIVPDFENDFYILQQSDQHLTTDLAVEPGGKSSTKWGNGSKQALEWISSTVNLINPRFLLHTGDNMQLYNEANNWCGMEEASKRVHRFLHGLSAYQVPTVVATGNHDIGFSNYILNNEWRRTYKQIMGQTAFSFHMGSFYVLVSEWTNKEFFDWAKADYAETINNNSVKYRLLASHFYEGLSGWTTIATDKTADQLVLVGHNHQTRTLQSTPFYALSTGTAQHYQRTSFFNFKRTKSGWSTTEPLSHADGVNVHKLTGPNGAPTVIAEYGNPNDASAGSNVVTITNSLPHDFYNGRIRFLMKKGRYKVSGGKVLAQYDYADGTKTAVVICVPIQKSGITKATIR